MAKLVSIDITMANNANDFLASLAAENHTSRADAQILLARVVGRPCGSVFFCLCLYVC